MASDVESDTEESDTVKGNPKTVVLKAFPCIHTEESNAEAEAMMEEVCSRLECGRDTLLTNIVYSLHWDHSAYVASIHTDQWSGVSVIKYDESARADVQCDLVEHGIAMAWKLIADHDETVKSKQAESAPSLPDLSAGEVE